MLAEDVNGDDNLDVIVCGNDFGNEVTDRRYDALNGLLMTEDGKGGFIPQTISNSGI